MEIKKENVLAAYETARKAGADSTMKVLEQLFGEETFKPVTERIKTFDDACNELGENHPFIHAYAAWITHEDLDGQEDIVAYLKLRIICAALNEGWEPQFTKNEYRYYPYFVLYTEEEVEKIDEETKNELGLFGGAAADGAYCGLASAGSYNAWSGSAAYIGSRLCLRTRELAVYCGRQFFALWADFYLIRK